jgi:hypothetical protein
VRSPAPPATRHVTGPRTAGSSGARGPGTSGTPPSGRRSAPLRSPARCCSSCRILPRTMWLAAAAPGRVPPGWPCPLTQASGLPPARAPPRRRQPHRGRHQPSPYGSTAPRPAHHLTAAGPGAWPTGATGAERGGGGGRAGQEPGKTTSVFHRRHPSCSVTDHSSSRASARSPTRRSAPTAQCSYCRHSAPERVDLRHYVAVPMGPASRQRRWPGRLGRLASRSDQRRDSRQARRPGCGQQPRCVWR